MKIKEVSFSETFPMNNGHFQKIFVTAEIEGDDDPKKALYEAKKLVNNFFYESNKAEEKKKEESFTDMQQSFLNGIQDSKTIEELETFWMQSKGNLVLTQAYNKRKKELNGTSK